jgi:hypothetical protein
MIVRTRAHAEVPGGRQKEVAMEFFTGYVTVAEVCKILTIHRSTLSRMRK